jgi:2'-5' RNA ligase
MRAFLAIEPDESTLRKLLNDIDVLRVQAWAHGVRWVGADHLHLTVRFFADISAAGASRYADLVRAELPQPDPAQPLTLTLSAPRLFPKLSHPRVIARLVEATPRLIALADLAERSAQAVGMPPEKRSFNGHLSLGRVAQSFRWDAAFADAMGSITMRARGLTLFESTLTPSGPIHRPIARFDVH